MSMSKTTNTYNRQNWEDSTYPILCETCLGDIPYVRMIKERHGKDCKICERPFTIFRWCPGSKMRFKKSEICQTCASLKNVCQTCLLDLEYGLPTQVRDTLLNASHTIPQSAVNKEYYTQNIETEMKNQENGTALAPSSVAELFVTNQLLTKLARNSPYYKRNRPHICSFWVKGNCARGEACPYRHEKPQEVDDPLIEQNIKDRYYGRNDPVADKILTRSAVVPNQLRIPEDTNITTLYIGNIAEHITDTDLRDNFYQFGEIRNVTIAPGHRYAFLQFTNRASAELAAENTFNKLILGGRLLTIKWAHSQGKLHQQQQEKQLQQIEMQHKQQPQLNNYGLYQSQQQHSQRLTKLNRYHPVTSTTKPSQPKILLPLTSNYFNL